MKMTIGQLMETSGVNFGTSGVRGLVTEMTDEICYAYTQGFLLYLEEKALISNKGDVAIAGDLRSSSPRIMNAVAAACIELGYNVINCGFIPSPAVALFGLTRSIPAIMVTGSHIPDDRNGIKFNTPLGELLKHDEQGIKSQQIELNQTLFDETHALLNTNYLGEVKAEAEINYIQRFIDFFPQDCLKGKHIGLYQHSSVGRDCIKTILERLGAQVKPLARSDAFVSVDTEAIRAEDILLANEWAQQDDFDCIVSTDGDADRPLVSDEKGVWLRGDVVGVLCADYLGADTIITPVSSNTMVEKSLFFDHVVRTKIGSPYVIEAMRTAEKENQNAIVVGYEANGGFLQQTHIKKNGQDLAALPTRDSVVVLLSVILHAIERDMTISELVCSLPRRYTHSDRIKNFPTEQSQKILADLLSHDTNTNLKQIQNMFPWLSHPISLDVTDGVRVTLENHEIIHLRPSGNAPELRCYCEAESPERASSMCEMGIKTLLNYASTLE
jgi:phosphomannomutase